MQKVPSWKTDAFAFVNYIDPLMDDETIWEYDKSNNLIIVTKDKDFMTKHALFGVPPKIVHIRFGNLKLQNFIRRIEDIWMQVESLIETHSVINIYLNKIEAIK